MGEAEDKELEQAIADAKNIRELLAGAGIGPHRAVLAFAVLFATELESRALDPALQHFGDLCRYFDETIEVGRRFMKRGGQS